MSDRSTTPQDDSLPFQCDAWSRRVHKCASQCDGCFRREYEPRLRRAEKLLREFLTTCEVHDLNAEKFFDLWSDAEAARVYFKEATVIQSESKELGKSIEVADRAGDFAMGQDRRFPDSEAITKQFRVQYAETNGLTDEHYPYGLRDGDVVDAKGRRVTISGARSIRDMLNEIAELRAAVAQRTPQSAGGSIGAPKQIIDPPGIAVEAFRRKHGRLPTRPGDHLSLTDRLELAAQACHAAHLLSCEATCRDAIEALSIQSASTSTSDDARQAIKEQAQEIIELRVSAANAWAVAEKAKADAYEAAARICEEMSYPPDGQERWHGTDNEWAAIKLEDAAKAIRERKAKVCHVTQATVTKNPADSETTR